MIVVHLQRKQQLKRHKINPQNHQKFQQKSNKLKQKNQQYKKKLKKIKSLTIKNNKKKM